MAWYENTDGSGDFGEQQIIADSAGGASSVICIDIDNDGDNDIVAACFEDDKITWYENTDGLGNFSIENIVAWINGPVSIYYADLDGDNDFEIISASPGARRISWYENTDGLGSFGYQRDLMFNADDAYCVFSSDLDNDGDYDILAGIEDRISWFRNETILGIEEGNTRIGSPTAYVIQSLYPNPFNPNTTVTIGLPVAGNLRVDVYNIMGQQVESIADTRFTAGHHSFIFNGTDLSSGIYFIRATVPGKMDQFKKVVLMK